MTCPASSASIATSPGTSPRFSGGNDLYQSLQHLPGAEGIEILPKAAHKVGVAELLLDNVREAQRDFDRVVLDSMGGAGSGERLEYSRKLAFRGSSGVWGLQARVRCTTSFVAPNRDNPDLLDLGLVGGLVDVRRLRAGMRASRGTVPTTLNKSPEQ